MMPCSMAPMLCLDCMPDVCTCTQGLHQFNVPKMKSCLQLPLSILLLSWMHARYRLLIL